MTVSSSEALKRFKAAQGRKSNWRTFYEDLLDYFAPQFDTFTVQSKGQDERGQGRIFDSTAQSAMQKFASNMQSSLVPPMKQWIKLVPGLSIPAEQKDDAARALEDISDIMFATLRNSNFDTQVAESFLDLAMGTGALMVNKGTVNDPISFSAIPLSEMFFEEGQTGRISSAFRQYIVPARGIQETWPDANLTADMKNALSTAAGGNKEFKLIEATVPDDIEVFNKQTNRKEKSKGFRHYVMTEGGDVIFETEMESSPWIIFRWAVRPGEIYGRGPATEALADVKSINKVKEIILKSGSMAAAGAYTIADDGIINIENIRIQPGAMIPVSANEGSLSGPTIAALPQAGDLNVGQFIFKDLQRSINEMMFADPLGPIDLPVKTATEVAIRQQELAKRIGASFGRLQFEFVQPLVNRILFVLEDLGLVDLNQFRVDGRFIDIEHQSPLSQAQNEEELGNIERFIATVASTLGPQAAALLMTQGMFERIAELLNIDPNLVPTEEELQQFQQQLALAAQSNQGA